MRFGEFRTTASVVKESKKPEVIVESLGNLKPFAAILGDKKAAAYAFGKNRNGLFLGPDSPTVDVTSVTSGGDNEKTFPKLERAMKTASRLEQSDEKPMAVGIFGPAGDLKFVFFRSSLGGGYTAGSYREWTVYGVEGRQLLTDKKYIYDRSRAKQNYKVRQTNPSYPAYNGETRTITKGEAFIGDWLHLVMSVMVDEPGTYKFVAAFADHTAAAKKNARFAVANDSRNKPAIAPSTSASFKMAEPYLIRIKAYVASRSTTIVDQVVKYAQDTAEASGDIPSSMPRNTNYDTLDSNKVANMLMYWMTIAHYYNDIQKSNKDSYTYNNAIKYVKQYKADLDKLLD